MKRFFIVDFENEPSMEFLLNGHLNSCDRVVIFYSENSNKISIDSLELLRESGCYYEFIKAKVGVPNALDFQLVVYSIEQIKKFGDAVDFYIVSKDKGIELAFNYYSELSETLSKVFFVKGGRVVINTEEYRIKSKHKIIFKECKEIDPITKVNLLVSILFQAGLNKSEVTFMTKSELHNLLVARFGNDKGKWFYEKIKKYIIQ